MEISSFPTFVVVSVAIGVVALPKQLQVLLITQGFTVGKAGMDLFHISMDSLSSASQPSISALSHISPAQEAQTQAECLDHEEMLLTALNLSKLWFCVCFTASA